MFVTLYTKIKQFSLKNFLVIMLKFQFYWTLAFIITYQTMGVSYCAPAWYKLFVDDTPQTLFGALSSGNFSWSQVIFVAVAGYALFKGVDYAANQAYGFFRGIYEGFTGKEVITFERKIDILTATLNKFNTNILDIKTKLDAIAFDSRIAREQLYFFDDDGSGVDVLRENFKKVLYEFADIKNAGNGLASQIDDFGDMLRELRSRNNTNPELVNLVARMEEIRQSVNAWNDQQGRALGESVLHLQSIISNLDNYNSEEITRAVSELRQNIGVIQNVVQQSLNTFTSPVLNEAIRLPEENNQMVEHSVNNVTRTTRPTVVAQEPVASTTRSRSTDLVETNSLTSSQTNNINLTGLNPGVYNLEVLANGGIHIDPVGGLSRTVIQGQNTFTNGLLSAVNNPNVQDLILNTGARFFANTMRPSQAPYMPYYPNMPMVPYVPQPSPGDVIANRGAEMGEAAGRILGKVGGSIIKGILGGF